MLFALPQPPSSLSFLFVTWTPLLPKLIIVISFNSNYCTLPYNSRAFFWQFKLSYFSYSASLLYDPGYHKHTTTFTSCIFTRFLSCFPHDLFLTRVVYLNVLFHPRNDMFPFLLIRLSHYDFCLHCSFLTHFPFYSQRTFFLFVSFT